MDDTMATRTAPTWLAALLVGALSLLLGLVTLGRKSFWFDEAFNGVSVRGTWGNILDQIGDTEMSQALYLGFLKAWARAVPNTDVWLRLPSVVAVALAAALLVPIGARLVDRNTGTIAGILLATNELAVRWSQQARTYALVTLAVVVMSLLFLRALDDPRRRTWLLYALCAGLAVYCHFFAGFVVVAQLASIPFAPRRPPWRRVLEAAALFAVLISVALYFTATAPRSQISYLPNPSLALVQQMVESAIGRNQLLLLAALAGLAVLARRARHGIRGAGWLLALLGGWLLLPVALPLLLSFYQPILTSRYMVVIAPGLAIAGAIAITSLWQTRRALGVAALAAVIALGAVQITHWYRRNPENWRAAVTYVNRERVPTDDVVVAPTYALHGLRFYDGSTNIWYGPIRRRTFLYLWGYDSTDRAIFLREAIGQAPVTVSAERRFGPGLGVVVVDPRR